MTVALVKRREKHTVPLLCNVSFSIFVYIFMDRALQKFLQANAIVMAAQNNLQFMWRLWMQAVGARNRRRCRGKIWTRGWILERPSFGLYENLLGDLERNDPRSYRNVTRCAQELFQFILQQITPAIARTHNNTGHPAIQGHSWNQV